MLQSLRHLFRRKPETVFVPIPAALSVPLTNREYVEIRDWLLSPTTQKVLALMEARHPGTLTAGLSVTVRSEWDQAAAVNYMHRIRGWESYRNALLSLSFPPTSKSEPVETYPSS